MRLEEELLELLDLHKRQQRCHEGDPHSLPPSLTLEVSKMIVQDSEYRRSVSSVLEDFFPDSSACKEAQGTQIQCHRV